MFFFSSRRRHTRWPRDWSSDVCSSDCDAADTAAAFERNFGIEYPSIEGRDGKVLLDFADYVPPQAVPTTLILDAEGRVAARVLGAVEHSTLKSLLTGVVEE